MAEIWSDWSFLIENIDCSGCTLILQDGVTWLLNSPEDSLGYILADSGYDVWIANSRGTAFSRQHISFFVNDSVLFPFFTQLNCYPIHVTWYLNCDVQIQGYWDWSWDELVAYDLPAIYEYVYRNSGRQKIHFVGHSLVSLCRIN